MTYNQIQKLSPFVDENFITFPLHIESNDIPFYNFWQGLSTKDDLKFFIRKAKDILKDTGYTIDIVNKEVVANLYTKASKENNTSIVYFQIYPIFETDSDNDGNVFANVDSKSFDVDAIDLLIKIISK